MAKQPTLFVPHGAPDLLLTDHVAKRFLAGLGSQVGRPAAIVIVSAHWEAPEAAVTTATSPETIYDFYGFPAELYTYRYPAKTDPALAERVIELLSDKGIAAKADPARGFDHGAWVPLILAYPEADIPVVQLSLIRGGSARQHFELGQALAPLREEGVLIVGSGSVTHNLRGLGPEGMPAPDWATDFDRWVSDGAEKGDWDELLQFPAKPATARLAHPTPEHFMPFYVAAGAGSPDKAVKLHESYSHHSISMSCFAFGDLAA